MPPVHVDAVVRLKEDVPTHELCCGNSRPASDYMARAIPRHEGVSSPLEASWIVWQK